VFFMRPATPLPAHVKFPAGERGFQHAWF